MTQWNSSYYRRKNYNRVIKGSIDSIVDGLPFLPVESEICSGILKSVTLNEFAENITNFIAVSPSLSFNLLNIVHSSFFSGIKKIVSLDDAVKILGNDISVHLINDFVTRSLKSQDAAGIDLCKSSDLLNAVKTAHLSGLISEAIDYSISFKAYIAALIHNVGITALSNRFPNQYSKLLSLPDLDHSNLVSSEDHALGINHCFLGARMVEHWDSFPFISDALFYHHHPLKKVKQANKLVKLIYFSSMVYSRNERSRLRYLETGKELFNLTESQIDEFISIADLKAQNRLLNLGIEISNDNSELIYQPAEKRESVHLNELGSSTLLSVLVDRIRKSSDKNELFINIGRSVNILTGINDLYYFKHNAGSKSLEGIRLAQPENALLCGDLTISIDAKSSIVVTSFLMGIEINSLERVNNTEPALFDIQIANLVNSDGLYCLPLINNDMIPGVIVFGVNNAGGTIKSERIERLRCFIELAIPFLSPDEVKGSAGSESKKNIELNSIQTRKLIHEINNPLSAIKNYLKVLNMKLDDINVENDEIRIIDDELDRISKLLKEFKSSPSGQKAEKTISSINSIISDTILLIKNSRVNGSEISIYFKEDENIPNIKIDKDAFRQILINLINNAIEAMPQGGGITVDVQYKSISQHSDDTEKIQISISDEGPGIPDSLKPNLFKKQSSTKADHDGLGLLIVYELVKRMGGTVVLDDTGAKGACFKISLPVN